MEGWPTDLVDFPFQTRLKRFDQKSGVREAAIEQFRCIKPTNVWDLHQDRKPPNAGEPIHTARFFQNPGHGDEDHKILNKIMIQRPRQSSIPFFDDVGWEMLIDQFDDPPNLNDDKRV
jgi:hypothetical protein